MEEQQPTDKMTEAEKKEFQKLVEILAAIYRNNLRVSVSNPKTNKVRSQK